jgi:peptidoglycan/LPS O-acetylase OafA/YrhL
LGRMLSVRPVAALGAWSYSIYLLHAPTHYAVMAAFAAIGHPTDALDASSARALLLVTALAVLGLSALTFHFFEVPARRWLLRALAPAKFSGTTVFPG